MSDPLKLQDGAQEFDLPEGAQDLIPKLLEAVKGAPFEVHEGKKQKLYCYEGLPACKEFSKLVFGNKAKDIITELSSLGWKPSEAKTITVPVIFGYDETIVLDSGDDAVVTVLITGPVEIEICTGSKILSHSWKPGKILLLIPHASLKLGFNRGNHDARMGDKEKESRPVKIGDQVEPGMERTYIFYVMFTVDKSH